jgi:hypothetical protein
MVLAAVDNDGGVDVVTVWENLAPSSMGMVFEGLDLATHTH